MTDLADRTYDSLHMGRSSIDLYANDVGAEFVDIESFAAYVGGSPTNTSVGVKRLGLQTGVLTALGKDPVGDFTRCRIALEDLGMQNVSDEDCSALRLVFSKG